MDHPTVMISLVSGQCMQNIIPLYQVESKYKKVWLIRSNDADQPGSRMHHAWVNTKTVLDEPFSVKNPPNSVIPTSISDTEELIYSILSDLLPEEKATINFTGGTKPMSIGAFLAAQKASMNALYVNSQKEELLWFKGDVLEKREKIQPSKDLTVNIYFQVNGRKIGEPKLWDPIKLKIADGLLKSLPETFTFMNLLKDKITTKKNSFTLPFDHPLCKLLSESGFLIPDEPGHWKILPKDQKFLVGGWLEVMSYVILRESPYFDQVVPNLEVEDIPNELDIVASRKGQLAIIECKTGDLSGSAILDKLQAIRKSLGSFSRGYIVTSKSLSDITEDFRNRANLYGMGRIIPSDEILDLPDIIRKDFSSAPF